MDLLSRLCAAGLAVCLAVAVFGPWIKCFPGMYHCRILYAVLIRKAFRKPIDYRSLFRPEVSRSRNCLFEVDLMVHKTNSTYFSDLDESRIRLLARIFPDCFSFSGGNLSVLMGGTSCIFFKAIAPFQSYEVHSQILRWDDKWLYIASWFLMPGGSRRLTRVDREHYEAVDTTGRSMVFAEAITKYCFKSGRLTVAPEEVLRQSILNYDAENPEKQKDAEAIDRAASEEGRDG
ncbi:hypothetical protein HRG_004227 [Hirsutella rhossiliensis]|uniref:Capsule polysaccharide biosynthesis protein n=1 Tax=Hirsutella rhossiliensis TaxID=111463 RepID=A0A9P8SJ30_9HYPO|nr:uncharacterized protein HRG_04227 [Hirsutella rhossiliensis]KAH0963799.1 hypothetical protein HRG_04227 [Hirsutella rhossiliensis]